MAIAEVSKRFDGLKSAAKQGNAAIVDSVIDMSISLGDSVSIRFAPE